MFRCDVTFGDRDEARQPRFGCQQIVAARVQHALGRLIADGEHLSGGIQKKSELHFVEDFFGKLVEAFNSSYESLGRYCRLLQRRNAAVNSREIIVRDARSVIGFLLGQIFNQCLTVIGQTGQSQHAG